jgi:glycine cleavage system H protein
VHGTVTEVNPKLNASPEVVNTDPYGEGWMIRMKLSNAGDVETLMDAAAYENLVA